MNLNEHSKQSVFNAHSPKWFYVNVYRMIVDYEFKFEMLTLMGVFHPIIIIIMKTFIQRWHAFCNIVSHRTIHCQWKRSNRQLLLFYRLRILFKYFGIIWCERCWSWLAISTIADPISKKSSIHSILSQHSESAAIGIPKNIIIWNYAIDQHSVVLASYGRCWLVSIVDFTN